MLPLILRDESSPLKDLEWDPDSCPPLSRLRIPPSFSSNACDFAVLQHDQIHDVKAWFDGDAPKCNSAVVSTSRLQSSHSSAAPSSALQLSSAEIRSRRLSYLGTVRGEDVRPLGFRSVVRPSSTMNLNFTMTPRNDSPPSPLSRVNLLRASLLAQKGSSESPKDHHRSAYATLNSARA